MHPRSLLTLPLVLLVTSMLAYAGHSTHHSLLTSAVAWLSICIYATSRLGLSSLWDCALQQRLAWGAGALLALAQVCERAVDAKDMWWAKALLPALVYAMACGGTPKGTTPKPESLGSPPNAGVNASRYGSKMTLASLTVCGLIALYAHAGSITVIALGLSYAVLEVLAFHLVERAQAVSHLTEQNFADGVVVTRQQKPHGKGQEHWTVILRDVSAVAATSTGIAALSLERLSFGGLAYYGLIGQAMGKHWVSGQGILSAMYAVGTALVHIVVSSGLILMIQRQGALLTTFVPLATALCLQLLSGFSFSGAWFAAGCAASIFAFLDEAIPAPVGVRMRTRLGLRFGKLLTLIVLVSCLLLTLYCLHRPFGTATSSTTAAAFHSPPSELPPSSPLNAAPPTEPSRPLQYSDTRVHPIKNLFQNAQSGWNAKLRSQSQTLEAAETEYKRRYGIPPPPHFDKWYRMAKKKGVQLIDEYDTIYHSLLPFWALKPATIRARARESLGFGDNNLMGLLIRNGKAVHVEGGQEWLQQAAVGMMEAFIGYLPDMDLAFNVHDEPRVVVPHDELSRLIKTALTKNIPQAQAQQTPRNTFSTRPTDMDSGKRIAEVKTTRFNVFAHQPTWIPSRLSCSPDSPSRALEESLAFDNMTAYALGDLGFIYNKTAFSDICNSPSLGHSHGFFDRPNAFNVVHDLFPIFSQSKMSSFQDILYPSPWYWFGKVSYEQSKDMDWDKKDRKLWWRGSTTGGFSRAGGWRRQHRQQFVAKVNALDTAKVLTSSNAAATDEHPEKRWVTKEVSRQDLKEIVDVHFSHVGQCDPGDCDAQREFFTIVEPADQQNAWKYRYLLDMDGNAFSGRFYAFLQSWSLPFKMAIFREWHEEWIQPWVHYIPLSLKAEEALEAVRYIDAEEEGRQLGGSIAEAGRDWAQKALRNEDFEVWLFRLLLEYGRVVDDDRAKIGYSGA